MRFNKIYLVYIVYVLDFLATMHVLANFVNSDQYLDPITENCSSVNGQAGECVPMNQCYYTKALLKRKPINYSLLDSLRCYKKNFIGSAVSSSTTQGCSLAAAVCCPLNYIERTTPRRSDDCPPSATPPDPISRCCGLDAHIDWSKNFDATAAIDQNPWLVVIGHEKNGRISYLCSGALISSQYVLTAAHCVLGPVHKFGKPKTVLLGKYNMQNAGQDCVSTEGGGQDCNDPVVTMIESILVHPDYNPSDKLRRHDIALIKMSELAKYTDFIRPICLPSLAIATSVNLTSAGWGTLNAPHSSSEVVQTVELPFVGHSDCQKHYTVNLWRGQICAGGRPGEDSCIGDPGGPLIYRNSATNAYELVGIYSFGPRPCALEEIPLVFTNVSKYNSWLRFHIETSCTTTRGDRGQCVDIENCRKVTTIQTDHQQFSSEECNEKGLPNKICCAEQCSISGTGTGRCSDLYRCPLVQNVYTHSNMSRCNGPEPYRVCCKSSEPVDAPSTPKINPIVLEESDCILTKEPKNLASNCCGQEILSEKVAGGSAAEIGQYPWLAIVVFETKFCGGALISGNYVLTAAHCFNDTDPLLVRLGEHDLACEELQKQNASSECPINAIDFFIKKTTLHPHYNPKDRNHRNDIALIQLDEMASYTDNIRPICLPSDDISDDPSTAKLFVSGWGSTNETTKNSPSIKQYVELPYVSNEVCQHYYTRTNNGLVNLDSSQICAGGIAGKDSCSGDSGGPLMNSNGNKYEVVGVVSFGQVPCGDTSAPGVYTKVYDYLAWISHVIHSNNDS